MFDKTLKYMGLGVCQLKTQLSLDLADNLGFPLPKSAAFVPFQPFQIQGFDLLN